MELSLPRRKGPPRALPNEMLLEIFSHVGRGQSRLGTLRSIALASRSFNHLVTPILYSKFSDSEYASRRIELGRPLCFLLRTIVHSPHLAQHLKVFEWGLSGDRVQVFSDADFERVLAQARDQKLHLIAQFWPRLMILRDLDDKRPHSVDPLVAVLLNLLPNIEELKMTMYLPEDRIPAFMYPTPHGVLASKNLAKLRILQLCAEHDESDPVDLTPWLQLPSITSLRANSIPLDIRDQTLGPLNLTTINLHLVLIEKLILEYLLKSCKNLRSFSYEILALPRTLDDEEWASPDEALWSIRDLASDTLTELTFRLIDSNPDSDDYWNWDDLGDWDFSFRNMKNLKVLDIDAPFILGTDTYTGEEMTAPQLYSVLPPDITELRLHMCGQRVLEEIGNVARITRSVYPALERITIDSFKTFFWTPAYLKDAQRRFRKAGVAFDYTFDFDYYLGQAYDGDLGHAYGTSYLEEVIDALESEKKS
ncbi:hypothetical protein BU16DRAFT_532121, partial [Lophium mytilinum]